MLLPSQRRSNAFRSDSELVLLRAPADAFVFARPATVDVTEEPAETIVPEVGAAVTSLAKAWGRALFGCRYSRRQYSAPRLLVKAAVNTDDRATGGYRRMERAGIEPATSALQTRRSPS
jgi:hypothetical protein